MSVPTLESTDVQPPTPPHHPTHGVRLSEGQIKSVILEALPEQEVSTIKRLPSGQSFNNRIYFISIEPSSGSRLLSNDVVLKVPGWNFGVDKIQNEVICLLLLETQSPAIPVPRVLAWYEGGSHVGKVHRSDGTVSITEDKLTRPSEHKHMWILMTHLPGQTLQPDHVEPESLDLIMEQLAGYMSDWRKIMPPTPHLGNLQAVVENEVDSEYHAPFFGLKVAVQGLLIGSTIAKINSAQDYYATKIRGEIDILKSNDIYIPNRTTVVPIVEDLLDNILPTTALFRRSINAPIFTHYDLSPRNILIQPNSSGELSISGIVDFEFAGFFPPEEECTNTAITNEGDWPEHAWASFLSHLEFLGVDVPKGVVWKQASALVRIIESIAPWQLRVGGIESEEHESTLAQARSVVQESIDSIKHS